LAAFSQSLCAIALGPWLNAIRKRAEARYLKSSIALTQR
jgi:hypothetical protein